MKKTLWLIIVIAWTVGLSAALAGELNVYAATLPKRFYRVRLTIAGD